MTLHHGQCTIEGVYDPWIPLAAARSRVWLHDGTEAVLVGIPRNSGQRARIEMPNGYRRTVQLADIAAVEQPIPFPTGEPT